MTLPGMPLATSDVFICKIDDGAPRDRPRRVVPAAPVRRAVWLVLGSCPHCLPKIGRYCHDHDANNWWLTKWGR